MLKCFLLFFNILCILILCDDLLVCMDVLSPFDANFCMFMWNYNVSDYLLCALCYQAILVIQLEYLRNSSSLLKHFYPAHSLNTCVLIILGRCLKPIDDYILLWIQFNCEAISLHSVAKLPDVSILITTFMFYAVTLVLFFQKLERSSYQIVSQTICAYICILTIFFYNTNLGLCLLLCLMHKNSLCFHILLCFHFLQDPTFYLNISFLYLNTCYFVVQSVIYLFRIYISYVVPWCNNDFHSCLLLTLLLLMCGDVEANPGPNQSDSSAGIKIQFANIRGLWANLLPLKASLDNSIDVLCLSETFLSSSRSDNDILIPGYQRPIRNDRPTFGGGSVVYVSNDLHAKRNRLFESKDIEIIALELSTGRNRILLFVAYRSPSDPIDYDFWNCLQTCIDEGRNAHFSNIFLTGDLNADPRTPNGGYLKHFSQSNGFTIHINEPTRIIDDQESCLDQIITNLPNFIENARVLAPIGTSDHSPVTCLLSIKHTKNKTYKRLIWLYSKANFTDYCSALRNYNWDQCFVSNDINVVCALFSETLINIAKKFIPNKTVTIRQDDLPWYDSSLRRLGKKKDRLYYAAKDSKKSSDWDVYKAIRNEYSFKLKKAEKTYYDNLANSLSAENNLNPKKWWRIVKSFMKRNHCSSIPALDYDNIVITDNIKKAEAFNDFFVKQTLLDESNADLPYGPENENIPMLTGIHIAESDVEEILSELNCNKATGFDGISPRILKEGSKPLSKPLARLFNMSLESAHFPDSWKLANVLPLHKKNETNLVNNYRPISLLSCVSKVFEKIVFRNVFNFFRNSFAITVHQSGFIPGDSTVNQLVHLYHVFCEALNKGKEIRVVFCDISKAFDKVWHRGLIHKLKSAGIRGKLLSWFISYLENRKQRVIIEGENSDWKPVKAGVPQGSVLGPLLFLIYINDIVNVVESQVKLFADDTSLFIIVEDPISAANSLNSDLTNISDWSRQWLVNFNPAKTECLLISRKVNPPNHPPLFFNNVKVANVDNHTHLGVTFTKDLSWHTHILSVVAKACKPLNVLQSLKYRLPRSSLEIIYVSFIRPIMEYADVVWDYMTDQDCTLLENVQLAAARVVTGAIRYTSHAKIYEECGWDTLKSRRENHKLALFHKIIYKDSPRYLQDHIPPTVENRAGRPLRNSSNISLIKTNTEYFDGSFFPETIRLWNNLEDRFKTISSHEAFTEQLNKPSTLIPKHYYSGSRKANIILARLRMGCSELNDDLYRIGVVNSPACSCGARRENQFHFFMTCPKYVNIRQQLHSEIIKVARFSIGTILYGDKELSVKTNIDIAELVHNFITNSGRFQ